MRRAGDVDDVRSGSSESSKRSAMKDRLRLGGEIEIKYVHGAVATETSVSLAWLASCSHVVYAT